MVESSSGRSGKAFGLISTPSFGFGKRCLRHALGEPGKSMTYGGKPV
jgi:hypothetical protein